MGILRSSQLPPGNPFIFTTMDAWKLRTGRRYAGICPGFASLQHNPFKRTAQGTHTMRRVLTKRITQHAYTNAVEGTSCYVLRVQHHPHRNHHHHQRHRIEGGCSIAFLVSFSHYFILFFLHFPSHFRSCFVENTPTQLCVLFDLRFWQLRNEANNANTVPGNRIRGRIRIEIGIGIGIGIGIS